MKKIITIELTSEERNLIETLPENPCNKCSSRSWECCGCSKISTYKDKIEGIDKEVLDLAAKYRKYKNTKSKIKKLIDENNEIAKELKSAGIDVEQ